MRQYDNTVRDLLALETPPTGGIVDWEGREIPSQVAQAYAEAATAIAAAFMADEVAQNQVLPCFEDTEACAGRIIMELGLRAYRRPPSEAEVQELTLLYERRGELSEDGSFEGVVESIVEQLIGSRSFFMREELSENQGPSGYFVLNDYEVASRLSYMLWESMPDAELFAAAAVGALQAREAVFQQTRRMVQHPRVLQMSRGFHASYVGFGPGGYYQDITKDRERFPAFTEAAVPAMLLEMELVIESVVASVGAFQDLFTTNVGFVNAALAPLYGLAPRGFGAELEMVGLHPTRPGVFTRVGFLAAHAEPDRSSPIRRGASLVRQVLCLDFAPTLDGPDTPLPTEPELVTNRQRVHAQTAGDACAGCHHVLINPLGYALEGFDAVGSEQTLENGVSIDTSADVIAGIEMVTVDGAVELMHALANSRGAAGCYALKLVSYAFQRRPNGTDLCLVRRLEELIASRAPILELIAELTSAESFLVRRDETWEPPSSPSGPATPPASAETPSSGGANGSGGTNGSDSTTATDTDPQLTDPMSETSEDDLTSDAMDAEDEGARGADAGSERARGADLKGVDDAAGAGGCDCRTFAAPTGARRGLWALAVGAIALFIRRRQ